MAHLDRAERKDSADSVSDQSDGGGPAEMPRNLRELATDRLAQFFWRTVGIYLDATTLAINIANSRHCMDNDPCLADAVRAPEVVLGLFGEGRPFQVENVTNEADRLMLQLFMDPAVPNWPESRPPERPSPEEAEAALIGWLLGDDVRLRGEEGVRTFVREIMDRSRLGACHRNAVITAFARGELRRDMIDVLEPQDAERLVQHLERAAAVARLL